MNQRILAYLALFLGILALGFSPIFVSLAQVNGLAATLYRTSIAASVLLIPFLLPRDNRLGTATTRPSLHTTMAIAGLGGLLFALNNGLFNTARRFLNALSYMVLSNLSSGLMIFIAMLVVGVPYRGFSLATYGYLFGLGFVSQAIGFLVIVYAQAYLPPSRVSTILLAQPLLVLVLASIILQEQPSTLQLAGMFTLFGGIVLANRR